MIIFLIIWYYSLLNNFYGLSKLLGEQIIDYEVKNFGLKAVILRPFMIYDEDEVIGEHRSAMIRFAFNLLKNNVGVWYWIFVGKYFLLKYFFVNIGYGTIVYVYKSCCVNSRIQNTFQTPKLAILFLERHINWHSPFQMPKYIHYCYYCMKD